MPSNNIQPPLPSSHSFRGSIVHDHTHYTNEGFGSLARNMIYPIIHIASTCHLLPHIARTMYDYNSARPNYKTHLQSVSTFLSLPEYNPITSDVDSTVVVELQVNTWTDPNIGSCCGDAVMIAKHLFDFLNQYNPAQLESNTTKQVWFVIRLIGAIRCMDPTPLVFEWLQQLSNTWKLQPKQERFLLHHNNNEESTCDNTSVTETIHSSMKTSPLRIVAHVRIPEDFTCQNWKEDNHIDKLYLTLDTVLNHIDNRSFIITIEIYTEEQFTVLDEQQLMERYQKSVRTVQIHRGTTETLLKDIQNMLLEYIIPIFLSRPRVI
jgi:hypothetical protein